MKQALPANWGSVKDNGLFTGDKDPMVQVPANGLGEDGFLEVAAPPNEVFNGVTVVYRGDILLNNGPIIEDGGGVVRGGSD